MDLSVIPKNSEWYSIMRLGERKPLLCYRLMIKADRKYWNAVWEKFEGCTRAYSPLTTSGEYPENVLALETTVFWEVGAVHSVHCRL